MTISTHRLELVPATAELLQAELQSPLAVAALLDVRLPESWPPEHFDAEVVRYVLARLAEPGQAGWWTYYFVRRGVPARSAELVGAGGFKGPPVDGVVEVGYSICPEHRRQGYATEATRGLLTHAFAVPGVTRVIAHTLPELIPSIGVLERCGFQLVGAGEEEGTIRFERGQR